MSYRTDANISHCRLPLNANGENMSLCHMSRARSMLVSTLEATIPKLEMLFQAIYDIL
jgi:hypothetical protein